MLHKEVPYSKLIICFMNRQYNLEREEVQSSGYEFPSNRVKKKNPVSIPILNFFTHSSLNTTLRSLCHTQANPVLPNPGSITYLECLLLYAKLYRANGRKDTLTVHCSDMFYHLQKL